MCLTHSLHSNKHYICSNLFVWTGTFPLPVHACFQRHTRFLSSLPPPHTQLQHPPFSALAPLLRIWMARRISRLKRATAAARSHLRSCSSDRRKSSTSMSGPRLIHPQSRRARMRSSLWYRGTSVWRSEPLQHLRLSVVPK